jgi:LysM repeat protein
MKRVLFVFFVILGFQSFGQRYAKMGERDGVKYYIHRVTDGETLYGIQTLYGVDIEKIKQANVGSETIEIGQRLYIPIRYHDIKHTVRNKETLYGISKKYSVPIDSLKAHNPDLTDGLKKGQQLLVKNLILSIELKTQSNALKQDSSEVMDPSVSEMILNDSIVEYTVQTKETLYSISKRFMVPMEVLLTRNNLSSTALKPGQVITIPLKRELKIKPRPHILYVHDSIKQTSFEDSSSDTKKFEAVVFLPFNLDTIDTRGYRSYALEYYMGAMLAIDSLKSYSVNGSFRFIDYYAKSMPFDSLLKSGELDSVDLIYAPFDFRLSEKLTEWAQARSVKIIYPLATHHALMLEPNSFENEAPKTYFMNPNTSALLEVMAKHLSTRDSIQIVLIKTSDSTEFGVYNEFLRLTQYLDLPVKIQEANFSNYTYFSKKKGLKTIYVLLSKCSPKIDELLKFSSETENVEVYGLKEWKKCSSYLKSIENLKGYRFPNPSYLSYENPELKRIHEVYRGKYNSDLTKMSCLGFDATLNMLLYALYDVKLPNGLVHKFDFINTGDTQMNSSAFMLEFKDLEENLIEP